MKRIVVFCVVTFVITYALEFGVVYPLNEKANLGEIPSYIALISISAMMFLPSIGVVLTRLITREGFKNALIKPVNFKRTFKYYLLAWFAPPVLIALGAAVYYLAFPGDFDPTMSLMATSLESQVGAEVAGVMSAVPIQTVFLTQLIVGVLFAPLLNIVTCFGEEWGWRGYLLPKVNERLSFIPTVLVTGVIWGLWHAPITAIGHNYGLGYPGYPYLGIFAMCCFCVVAGTFLSYVTVKAKSCLPAAIGHGAINGFGSIGIFFSATGGNPFVGPFPVGIVGGTALIIVAVVICIRMRKEPRWTQPAPINSPAAGTLE